MWLAEKNVYIEPVSMRLALSTKLNQKALSSPSSIKVYLETLSMRLAVLSPDTFKLDAMSHSVSRLQQSIDWTLRIKKIILLTIQKFIDFGSENGRERESDEWEIEEREREKWK